MTERRGAWTAIALLAIALAVPQMSYQAPRGDFSAHLRMVTALGQGNLLIPHLLFHVLTLGLAQIFTLQVAVVILMTCCLVAEGLLVYEGLRRASRGPLAAGVVTGALLIAHPICFFTFPHLYLGYLPTNTWHNPTVNLLRPLAVALFLAVEGYLIGAGRRGATRSPAARGALLTIGLLALLSTLAKPSYSMGLLPALLVFGLIYFSALDKRRFAIFLLVVGGCAALVIAWQFYFLLYGGGTRWGDQGLTWAPFVMMKVFDHSGPRTALKIALSLVFPVLVVGFYPRPAARDQGLVLTWITVGVAFGWYALFIERGRRAYDGNMLWGVMVAMFILFFASSRLLLRVGTGWRARVGWSALGLHVAGGILFYIAALGAFRSVCPDGYYRWCW